MEEKICNEIVRDFFGFNEIESTTYTISMDMFSILTQPTDKIRRNAANFVKKRNGVALVTTTFLE